MHGLINRAIEQFTRDSYGDEIWQDVRWAAGVDVPSFEAMLTYDDALTSQVLQALADALAKPAEDLLEDIGTHIVAAPGAGAIRRLLRFGGADFQEFLHSLDEMPARARLAVPELDLPVLELRQHTAQQFLLTLRAPRCELAIFSHMLLGLLRAMADEYGALVLLEHKGGQQDRALIEISLLDSEFAQARAFELGRVRA